MRNFITASLLMLLLAACQDDKGEAYVQSVQAAQAGITAITIDEKNDDATDEPDITLTGDPIERRQLGVTFTGSSSTTDYSTDVNWSSNVPSVATVDKSGIVTAVAAGETVITASFAQYSDNITVKVSNAKLVSIELDPIEMTVDECRSTTVKATGSYDDGETGRELSGLNWSTTDAAVATAEDLDSIDVKLLTHSAGSAEITATSGTITSASATVTVAETLTSISLSPTSVNLEVGESETIIATGNYSDGSDPSDISETASWSLASTSQADFITLEDSYPDKGQITAVGTGTAVVSAECGGTFATQSSTVIVSDALVLQSVSYDVADDPWSLTTSDSPQQLTLYANYDDGSSVDVTESATWEIIGTVSDLISVSDDSGDKGEITFATGIEDITEVESVIIRATYEDEFENIEVRVLVPSGAG